MPDPVRVLSHRYSTAILASDPWPLWRNSSHWAVCTNFIVILNSFKFKGIPYGLLGFPYVNALFPCFLLLCLLLIVVSLPLVWRLGTVCPRGFVTSWMLTITKLN